jgi:hypothetical protein
MDDDGSSSPACTCGHIRVGQETWPQTVWSDSCPRHGVGTVSFQGLKQMPFGYATERWATREDWLAFLASGGMDDKEEE